MRGDLLQRYVINTLFSLQTTMINDWLKQTVQYMYIALMFNLVYGFRYDFRWLLCKGSHEPWISGSVHEIHQIRRSWDCSWLRISEVLFTHSDSAREYRRIRKNNRFAYCRGSRLPYANPDSPTHLCLVSWILTNPFRKVSARTGLTPRKFNLFFWTSGNL